ncbi:hypothetical protein [Lysobacter firmicutimachus]|uniref:Lipoprotein n=1 Tax=Lysobacter firmicutimachus TaxID=1792846 RepID=A0ABU8D0Z0_9GAMM
MKAVSTKGGSRTARLAALAAGVFGFAASVTAFAAIDRCEECRTNVLEPCQLYTPDARPSCFMQYRACLTAYGCQLDP